jgi:putative flippase GtrA
MPERKELRTLIRSTLAGGAATLADLIVLSACVALGVSPRIASIPALVAGGVVNFYGNRHFAFRARSGSLSRQATLYAITELVALALNGLLFDAAMRTFHPSAPMVLVARLITTNLVFVFFSYPIWRRVFRTPDGAHA